jgi:hypothetical protein
MSETGITLPNLLEDDRRTPPPDDQTCLGASPDGSSESKTV